MTRYVQYFQAALACGLMVALIFSIPMLMAAAPVHLDISVARPNHLLGIHPNADIQASPHVM
ncbi:MAG: hypothetical protein ABWZ19_07670 [Hyphomicrobium sp.]